MKKGKEELAEASGQKPKPGGGEGSAKDDPATQETSSPRTRSQQEKVWEEEGGSPPGQISATKAVKPRTESKAGSMGPPKD